VNHIVDKADALADAKFVEGGHDGVELMEVEAV